MAITQKWRLANTPTRTTWLQFSVNKLYFETDVDLKTATWAIHKYWKNIYICAYKMQPITYLMSIKDPVAVQVLCRPCRPNHLAWNKSKSWAAAEKTDDPECVNRGRRAVFQKHWKSVASSSVYSSISYTDVLQKSSLHQSSWGGIKDYFSLLYHIIGPGNVTQRVSNFNIFTSTPRWPCRVGKGAGGGL